MAPIVDCAELPNDGVSPVAQLAFPLLLDFTDSLVTEEGVLGLVKLLRRAQREQGAVRLRLRDGGQFYQSLSRKGIERLFVPVTPLERIPNGVIEWSLQ